MNIIKKIGCLLLTVCIIPYSTAQNWLWGKAAVANQADPTVTNTTATDTAGNVWIAGVFDTTLIFGPDTLRSSSEDAYMAKYDRNGNFLWAKEFTFIGDLSYCTANCITLDNFGHLYMAGAFGGTLIVGQDTLYSPGLDIFLAKFDLNGNLIWITQSTGQGNVTDGLSITTDRAGNIYVGGTLEQSNNLFGPYTLSSGGSSDFFLVKYDFHGGRVIWAKQSLTTSNATLANMEGNIATDASANIYVTGTFYVEISFGSYIFKDSVPDIVLVKYDSSGNVIWAKDATTNPMSGSYNMGNGVAVDLSGNIYISGAFSGPGSIQFGAFSITSATYYDIFWAKYDPSGNVLWAKSGNVTPNNIASLWEGYWLATDNSNHLYMVTTQGNGSTLTLGTESFHAVDNFHSVVAKFDSNGNILCGSLIPAYAVSIAVDPKGKYIYVAGGLGGFQSTDIFGTDTLYGIPNNDVSFVARWENCCSGTSIAGDTAICSGFSTSLSVSGGFGAYVWNNGETSSAIIVNPSQSQKYAITINEGTCISVDSVLVTMNPLPTITFGGDSSICKGDSGFITISGADNYLWNNGATTTSITINQSVPTTYSVKATKAGCVTDTSISVYVIPLPKGSVSSPKPVCPGITATLIASGGSIYSWSNGETTSSISISPASSTTYTVNISNGECSIHDSATVIVNSLPVTTICCDSIISSGENVQLISSGGQFYSWAPPAGLSCDTCPNPIAAPAQTTTYTLTVTSDSGCAAQRFVTIDISCGDVFVPNVFAPDETTHNNILYVRSTCIASMDFLVFDRWGNKVFESENENTGWDGTYKGQPMTPATYVWYLKATMQNGTSLEKKGNVTLVR